MTTGIRGRSAYQFQHMIYEWLPENRASPLRLLAQTQKILCSLGQDKDPAQSPRCFAMKFVRNKRRFEVAAERLRIRHFTKNSESKIIRGPIENRISSLRMCLSHAYWQPFPSSTIINPGGLAARIRRPIYGWTQSRVTRIKESVAPGRAGTLTPAMIDEFANQIIALVCTR